MSEDKLRKVVEAKIASLQALPRGRRPQPRWFGESAEIRRKAQAGLLQSVLRSGGNRANIAAIRKRVEKLFEMQAMNPTDRGSRPRIRPR